MLTLFTAPKPFRDHIGIIQTNAIRSWQRLAPDVEILLVGQEEGMAEAATELGVRQLTDVRRSESGAPSLRSAFAEARRVARHPILGYVNADILLLDDFARAVDRVATACPRFLLLGQRWDLDVRERMTFAPGWQDRLRQRAVSAGRLHRPVGSDYFVFPAGQYDDLPDFTLGRSGWDNWMIYAARRDRIPVIDAGREITAVHQNHDYSHLPGARPHYRHPESLRNVEIAGGREVIFRLEDADWNLQPGGPRAKRWREWRYPRRWEADLIARFGPGRRARFVRLVARPCELLMYLLGRAGVRGAASMEPRQRLGSPGGTKE